MKSKISGFFWRVHCLRAFTFIHLNSSLTKLVLSRVSIGLMTYRNYVDYVGVTWWLNSTVCYESVIFCVLPVIGISKVCCIGPSYGTSVLFGVGLFHILFSSVYCYFMSIFLLFSNHILVPRPIGIFDFSTSVVVVPLCFSFCALLS